MQKEKRRKTEAGTKETKAQTNSKEEEECEEITEAVNSEAKESQSREEATEEVNDTSNIVVCNHSKPTYLVVGHNYNS